MLNNSDAEDATAATPAPACRLCESPTAFAFKKEMIGKYTVSFYRCEHCGSQQTENPYWLSEAYSDHVTSIDPGAAQRVLDCLAITSATARIFGYRKILDFGGGAGLLTRLLRDAGYDAYWYDQYTPASYATGFEGTPTGEYDLITSVEVVEHFANPKTDLGAIFGAAPKAVLIVTCLYEGQDENWWYLAPEEGQHIFFYSPKAIELIASRYNYHVLVLAGFILFTKAKPTNLQTRLLRKIGPRAIFWLKLLILARRTKAPQVDSALLEERARRANSG
jgi:Methyltransferase domain